MEVAQKWATENNINVTILKSICQNQVIKI